MIPFSFASCFSWLKSRAIRGNEKARSRAVILGAVGWRAGVAGAGAGVAGTSVGVGSVAVGVGQGMISSCERDGRFRFRLNDYVANGFPIFPIPFTGDDRCVVLKVTGDNFVTHIDCVTSSA